jgi:hypothetical protein
MILRWFVHWKMPAFSTSIPHHHFFVPAKKTKPQGFTSPQRQLHFSQKPQAFLHIFTFPGSLAGEDAPFVRL